MKAVEKGPTMPTMAEKETVANGFRDAKEFEATNAANKWTERKDSKVVYPIEGGSAGKVAVGTTNAKLSAKTEGMIKGLISQPLE